MIQNKMFELFFVSKNVHKYNEINSIFSAEKMDVDLKFYKENIIEIQEEKIEKIAIEKANTAYNIVKKPLIIEDDGLFIKSLNGFPGQYSSFVLKSIGNMGIINLLKGKKERSATFKSIIVYHNGIFNKVFSGEIDGTISSKLTVGGWGYDPIFIPHNERLTFGQLSKNNRKNELSHRKKALKKFSIWLRQNLK